jgi:hypothetical protein
VRRYGGFVKARRYGGFVKAGSRGDVKSAIAMVKFGLRAQIGTSISVTHSHGT